jgi:lysine 2,3-aminomutase
MLLSTFPRRGSFARGPITAVPRLVSARTVGSVPRLQAQVADINKVLEDSNTNLPPSFHTRPAHEPKPLMTPRPVASALPQNQDEFWRKVPVWSDVSAKEFLSYSWSVCPPWFRVSEVGLVSHKA